MQKNLRIRKLQQKNLRIFPFFERKIKTNGTDYVYIHNPFHSFYFFGIKAKTGSSGE
ncbi:hypothetical protein EfmAA242_11750 [Enterococcus faecium]|nr:hypothetical protein EfmAA242_11750 [Enterococcus faecium]